MSPDLDGTVEGRVGIAGRIGQQASEAESIEGAIRGAEVPMARRHPLELLAACGGARADDGGGGYTVCEHNYDVWLMLRHQRRRGLAE